MANLENVRRRESNLSGWNIAAALGLLAVAFLIDRGAPPNDDASPIPPKEKRDTSSASLATESEDRGRHATSPAEIPAKGWKDILLRVYGNIGNHRILALAAGMTYYSILARLLLSSRSTASFPTRAASPSISTRYPDSSRAAPSTSRASSSRAWPPRAIGRSG